MASLRRGSRAAAARGPHGQSAPARERYACDHHGGRAVEIRHRDRAVAVANADDTDPDGDDAAAGCGET
jgi:hypothetical protein